MHNMFYGWEKKHDRNEGKRGLSGNSDHFGETNGVKMLNPITKCTSKKMSTSLKVFQCLRYKMQWESENELPPFKMPTKLISSIIKMPRMERGGGRGIYISQNRIKKGHRLATGWKATKL